MVAISIVFFLCVFPEIVLKCSIELVFIYDVYEFMFTVIYFLGIKNH